MENEFHQDLKIDPDRLDECSLEQAELFFKYSERAADAKAEIDRAKFDMELTLANLQNSIRKYPAKYGLVKVTDTAVETTAKGRQVYINAYERWVQARRISNLLDKAVDAFEQRKRMLELLVQLHGQQYFAGPSVPHNLVDRYKQTMQQRAQRSNSLLVEGARKPKQDDTD